MCGFASPILCVQVGEQTESIIQDALSLYHSIETHMHVSQQLLQT